MMGENVILIGLPTAGKSTIGVVLAKQLGYDYIDTDLLIQQQEGCRRDQGYMVVYSHILRFDLFRVLHSPISIIKYFSSTFGSGPILSGGIPELARRIVYTGILHKFTQTGHISQPVVCG